MAFALFKGLFGGGDIYGKKPVVPELEAEASKAITSNINLLPDLGKLAEAFNSLSQESMNKQFEQAIPGFSDFLTKTRDIESGLLEGRYPDAVQKSMEDQVSRTSSAWNFSHGVAGSAFGVGKLAFDRSGIPLKAFETGLSTMDRWVQLGRMRLAPSLNLGSFMISPEQQFQRDWQAALIKAAPSPTARGQFDQEMGILGMALSAYSGGAGYTQGYKPNYSSSPVYQQPPPSNVYGNQYQSTPLLATYGSESNPAAMPSGGYGATEGAGQGTGEGFNFGIL